ncbi:Thymidine kinase 2 mitochondrial, partial [Caligus rogercresseyi]
DIPIWTSFPEPINKWTNLNGTDLLGPHLKIPPVGPWPRSPITCDPMALSKSWSVRPHSAISVFSRQFYEAGQMTEV